MPRYFSRPRSFWVEDDYYADDSPAQLPTVSDHEPVDTGIIDVNGNPIMRAPNPVGFGRDDEW